MVVLDTTAMFGVVTALSVVLRSPAGQTSDGDDQPRSPRRVFRLAATGDATRATVVGVITADMQPQSTQLGLEVSQRNALALKSAQTSAVVGGSATYTIYRFQSGKWTAGSPVQFAIPTQAQLVVSVSPQAGNSQTILYRVTIGRSNLAT